MGSLKQDHDFVCPKCKIKHSTYGTMPGDELCPECYDEQENMDRMEEAMSRDD